MKKWVEICDLVEKSEIEFVAVTEFGSKMSHHKPTKMMRKKDIRSLFDIDTIVECVYDGYLMTVFAGNNVIVFPH